MGLINSLEDDVEGYGCILETNGVLLEFSAGPACLLALLYLDKPDRRLFRVNEASDQLVCVIMPGSVHFTAGISEVLNITFKMHLLQRFLCR